MAEAELHSDIHSAEYPIEKSFLDEIITQCRPGPGVELPTAKMFQTLLMYHEAQPIKELLHEASIYMLERGVKEGAAVSGLRTTLVHYFRSRYEQQTGGQEFPDTKLLTVYDWKPYFDMLIEDAQAEKGGTMEVNFLFHAGIRFLDAVTPIKERYLSVELLAQLTKERFPDGVRVLDYGSSVMAGPLYLMNKQQFDPVGFDEVTHAPGHDNDVEDLTEKANRIISRESPFKDIVCVDIFNVYFEYRNTYDSAIVDHAISGLRPSERNNPAYLGALKKAMNLKQAGSPDFLQDTGVTFVQGSFLEPADLAYFKDTYPESFDVIVANYVTQEISESEQLQLHSALTGLLSENGMLIYNHQAFIPENIRQPAPIDKLQHLGSYATQEWLSNCHVVDRLNTATGLQKMMNYYDNRCRRARLGAGKLVVNGVLEPIVDLVRNS